MLVSPIVSNETQDAPTLKVEENVGLVVLEHLGDKLNVQVLDVDVLSHVRP